MPCLSPLDTISEPSPAIDAAKPTLLIVDDEEGPRTSLRIVFKHDYNVLLANSGIDAILLARQHRIDVAVLDILMHGMTGDELLRELKDIDPAIEVVMLTAYETLDTVRRSLRYGASDYLQKPFDIPTMRAAVARAAKKRTAGLEIERVQTELHQLQSEIQDQRVAEEMERAKGEIYASVLHDLNSPLTIIGGFIEMITESMRDAACVEGKQLESLKSHLGRLNGQVSRCFEISRRYLSFLRAVPMEKATVGVNQILSDLRELLARHPSANGNELAVHGLEEDVTADIHGTDFLQILINLTINALQATESKHRVEIRGRLLTAPIDVAAFPDGPTQRFINREGFANRSPILALSIADTGPGISPPVLAKMFEERFTTKSADRGTGLGLSIVRRLLREAEGAIMIRTEVGAGSTFIVLLQTRA